MDTMVLAGVRRRRRPRRRRSVQMISRYPSTAKSISSTGLKFAGQLHCQKSLPPIVFGLVLKNKMAATAVALLLPLYIRGHAMYTFQIFRICLSCSKLPQELFWITLQNQDGRHGGFFDRLLRKMKNHKYLENRKRQSDFEQILDPQGGTRVYR